MPQKAYQVFFDGEAAPEEFYGDVESLVVEENTTAAGVLRLRLATTLGDDGSWSYLEDDRLALFSRIKVSVGFLAGGGLAGALGGITGGGGNDGLSPVFDGYVTATDVTIGSDTGSGHLEISAMDTSVLMSLEEKTARWPDLADSDIVEQILRGYGVETRIDATPTTHQENDTTIVQRGTDIQFVRDLARKNGLEFFFETDADSDTVVAHWRAPDLEGKPQPDLAIRFGDASNLRSFTARLSGQRPLTVKTQQIDVKANGVNAAQAADTQRAKLGDKDLNALAGGPLNSLVTPRQAQAQMLVLGPPTSDATELQTIAQAVRDEAAWLIAASGEINSDAYAAVLRPHRLVLIKGAGTPYSGKYYVTRVVHDLGGDGSYIQRFEARRNARDLDGSEEFGGTDLGVSLPGL
jgi:phage protein D